MHIICRHRNGSVSKCTQHAIQARSTAVTLNESWGTFWSSKDLIKTDRTGKRESGTLPNLSTCEKEWNVNVHVDVWLSDMTSVHKVATVLILYYVKHLLKTKEKKAWQECKSSFERKALLWRALYKLTSNQDSRNLSTLTENIPYPQFSAGFGKSGARAHVYSASSCSAVCILWA